MAQSVKNLPALQETWVQSLSQEDPLDKGMSTHSRALAWRIPRTGAWWAIVRGVTESQLDMTERLALFHCHDVTLISFPL